MRTLVTGAAGFIGSALVDRLLEEGLQVTGVDNLSAGAPAANLGSAHRHNRPNHFTFVAGDVRHPKLADIVAGSNPDVVFHLAAQIDARRSLNDPQYDASNNVLGTINLLEACRRARIPRIVYASGGSRYGAPATLPATEDTPVDPLSPYAAAKVTGEFYMRAYAGMYGMSPICLALANVYGPRQDTRGEAGEVAAFGRAMISGRPTTIYGDGSATRDYVYVDDVVTAFLCAADAPITTTGTFNIGTGVQTTFTDLHQLIAAAVGVWHPPDHAACTGAGEVQASALDPTRAARMLGWKPDTELTEGIKRTVDWLRASLDAHPPALAQAWACHMRARTTHTRPLPAITGGALKDLTKVGDLIYTLTIDMNGGLRKSEHETLRDARAALIRYQSREGLWFTINRSRESTRPAQQTGDLRAGTNTVGAWCIS